MLTTRPADHVRLGKANQTNGPLSDTGIRPGDQEFEGHRRRGRGRCLHVPSDAVPNIGGATLYYVRALTNGHDTEATSPGRGGRPGKVVRSQINE